MERRTGSGGVVITANRLTDGRVIFLTPAGWTVRIEEAAVAIDEEERRALEALARRSAVACEVVDPYAVPVALEANGPRPVELRERWRVFGPGPGAEKAPPGGEDPRVSP